MTSSKLFLLLLLAVLQPGSAVAQAPTLLEQWGSPGSGDGEFQAPYGIAVDALGYVYVTDTGNSRIQKFTSNGVFVSQWGSYGSGPGLFLNPSSIAVDDASGHVYVTEFASTSRVQKFTTDGEFVTQWIDDNLHATHGLAVDRTGRVHVSESVSGLVFRYTSSGAPLGFLGGQYPSIFPGAFDNPHGLAFSNAGDLFVADLGNNRIQRFAADDTFVMQWGTVPPKWLGTGEFDEPVDVEVDGMNNLYVADQSRVRMYTLDGGYVAELNGSFLSRLSVAADAHGNVYVADSGNNQIKKFGYPVTSVSSSSWGRIKSAYRR